MVGASCLYGANLTPFAVSSKESFGFLSSIHCLCIFSLKKFPFDVQRCSFEIELWDGTDIEYFVPRPKITPLPPAFMSPSDTWTTEATSFIVWNYTYNGGTNYSRAARTFLFRRLPLHDMVNIFYPCFALTFLLFGSGFIPAKSPDRSVFCITVVLAFSVAQQSVSEKIPKSGDIPYALAFLSFQMAVGVICTLYSLATCRIANMKAEDRKIITRRISLRKIDMIFYILIVSCAFIVDITILCLILS